MTDIASAELLDMTNDELSSGIMEEFSCQLLSTDVVKEAISEETKYHESAIILCTTVNKAWYAAFYRGLIAVVKNKIRLEGLTERILTVIESIYARNLFHGLGSLTELETIEIQPVEFEYLGSASRTSVQ